MNVLLEKGVNIINTEIIHYCDYGCGQEAHHKLKNGKWCCSKSCNSCPSVRKKNSEAITKAHENGKILTSDAINKLKQYHPWNYGLKKPKIYHPGKCEVCGKDHDGTYGSGRFCSQSCANRIGIKVSQENQKLILISKVAYKENPKLCKICGKPIPYESRFNRTTCSTECSKILVKRSANDENTKNKIKESYIKHGTKPGGYHKGSGRGKSGFYKGYWCDSSWELAFTIYNIDHNIKFQRFDYSFDYEYQGKQFKYYPDYLMEDGTIIEIKGRSDDPQWKAKLKSIPNSFSIKVLTWKEIQPYLKYAETKYGKDFLCLYENKCSKLAQ